MTQSTTGVSRRAPARRQAGLPVLRKGNVARLCPRRSHLLREQRCGNVLRLFYAFRKALILNGRFRHGGPLRRPVPGSIPVCQRSPHGLPTDPNAKGW